MIIVAYDSWLDQRLDVAELSSDVTESEGVGGGFELRLAKVQRNMISSIFSLTSRQVWGEIERNDV